MADLANRTSVAGGLVYTHPLTGETFDSVTTVLDLVDKTALKQWAANLAADFVIEHIPQFLAAVLTPECGNTNNRCYTKHGKDQRCERCPCGQCQPCWRRRAIHRHRFESGRRAEEGIECHAAIHHWITTGGQVVEMRPEVRPYFGSFLAWVREYGLHPNGQPGQGDWEQLEITLLNREHRYAGTSDGAVWISRGRTPSADHIVDRIGGPNADRVLVRIDYKTREKPDEQLYYDMPLQAVAYERCPVAMLPDGREFAPPSTHARAVLQLRPGEQYSFKPMLSDDAVFEAFLGVLRAYHWIKGPGKNAFDLEVWAAIPPGVLGAPELSDPWAVDDPDQCPRCDHKRHEGHACDPGCFCPPEPDRVVVPFRSNSSVAAQMAQVVPLRTAGELKSAVDAGANPTNVTIVEPGDLPQSVCGYTETHEPHAYEVPYNGDDGPFTLSHWCPGVSPDPFAAHNDPAQVKADATRPPRKGMPKNEAKPAKKATKAAKKTAPAKSSVTVDSIRNFDPGPPDQTALDEPIPF